MTFASFHIYTEEPNRCGCYRGGCDCPEKTYQIESFYDVSSVKVYLLTLLREEHWYYIQKIIVNGLIYSGYDLYPLKGHGRLAPFDTKKEIPRDNYHYIPAEIEDATIAVISDVLESMREPYLTHLAGVKKALDDLELQRQEAERQKVRELMAKHGIKEASND